MSGTTVVIPTYNEVESLAEVVAAVLAVRDDLRVLVVDDNSPDGTGALADRLAAETGRVAVLHRPGKLGLGTAYVEGFTRALATGADAVFSMDGDGSHDPEYLPVLLDAFDRADVVVGSRYLSGVSVVNWSIRRLILSRGANEYVRRLTGLGVRDCTSGFVGYRRAVIEAIDLASIHSEGYAFTIEMKYRARHRGYRLVEVPIIFVDRRMGASKLSGMVMTEAFWLPWRLMLDRLVRR
jgi:dolichol-phosphate mannosyltransferase